MTTLTASPETFPVESPRAERGTIPALDGVRGLAILFVMVFHYYHVDTDVQGLDWLALKLSRVGWCGVDLFFVLSGFLITGILWDARGSTHYFARFYARRTLRIFPLYYGFLTVLLLATRWRAAELPEGLRLWHEHQAWYWAYLANFLPAIHGTWDVMPVWAGPLWSLAVEEQFYLVWPLVVWKLSRRTLMRLCMVAFAGGLATRLALTWLGTSPVATYALTPCRMDVLLTGAYLALHVRGATDPARDAQTARRAMCAAGAGLIALFAARRGLTMHDPWSQTLGITLLAVLFAGFVFLAATTAPRGFVGAVLTHPLARMLGRYSYGIYLLHVPIEMALARCGYRMKLFAFLGPWLAPRAILYSLGCIVATTLAAAVSYHLFEKHFLRLKRFFPY